ncbi:MAG: polysaccharide biosynthesis protein [Kiritimatiellales bacterium]|nr:polysaccharide biosynthesis protein [Kiritimatiellales bacterium]
MSSFFHDKTVLITGATGSVGSEVTKQILALQPAAVRLFSRDEHKQYLLQRELESMGHKDIRSLLGDIRDYPRLLRALEGVDYVFHCAAYKHVPFCEYNSFEAVKTNVVGTQNIIDAAITQEVERVLLVSTDKAASPSSVMGATKLLAEKLMTSAMYAAGTRPIRFASVRFGNVLASRGSALPLFCDQIRQGGPVTITAESMVRFFMSIPQAVTLTLRSMERMEGGELFILKMPVIVLGDLIDVLIEEVAPRYGKDPASIEKKIIGIRPGEKMSELLMTKEESQYAVEEEDVFVVRSPILLPNREFASHINNPQLADYDSAQLPPLSKEEIRKLLTGILEKYLEQVNR